MEMADILRGETEVHDEEQSASNATAPVAAAEVVPPATTTPAPNAPASETSTPPTGEQSTQPPAAAATGQAPTAPGATPGTEAEVSGLLSALKDERTKRQQLKSEVDELRRLVGERSAQPPQTQQQEQVWDDRVLEDIPGAFRRVEQSVTERMTAQLRDQRYRQSETYARQFIPDYAEVMADYPKLIENNAQLAQFVDQADAPALAAYQAVRQYRTMQANSPQAIEQRVRGEAQSRIQQLESEVAQLRAQSTAGSVPTSLTSARGSGAATPRPDDDSEPTPWNEILKPRARRR